MTMAAEAAVTSTPPSIEEEERHQETTLTGSLARLQEAHVALRHLRDTIPRIVSTLQQQQLPSPSPTPSTTANVPASLTTDLSPDDLYARFAAATLGAGNDIKRFTQLMGDASTKEILERAKARKDEDTEGIEGWKVVEHEDWLEEKKEDGDAGAAGGGDEEVIALDKPEENKTDGRKEEDVMKVVESFKEGAGKGFECTVGEQGRRILVVLPPPPARLRFQIEAMTLPNSQFIYKTSCEGLRESLGSIQNAIDARPRPSDLAFLLEMISTYADLYQRKCKKCERLLDRAGKLPVMRSRSRIKQADGKYVTEWDALHLSCR